MSWGQTKDMGAYMAPEHAGVAVSVTAGGAGDATEVNGAWIDTKEFESMEVLFDYTATLAEGETLSLAANIQDADDIAGTGAADVSTEYLTAMAATVVATGDSAGSTETGVYGMGVDLTKYRRYVRCQVTPDLSATATDTANLQGIAVFGGGQVLPQ